MATINFYSKEQMDTKLSGYQVALSQAQQDAVDSGITSAKVSTYDGYATGKMNALASAPSGAHALISVNGDKDDIAESTVTSTELGYLSGVTSGIQTQLNGKQATLSIVLTDNAYYTMTY